MNFWHSDRFSIPCYLLGSLIGLVAGILSVAIIAEVAESEQLLNIDFAAIPAIAAAIFLFTIPLTLIGFFTGSILMVPCTALLISWARRNKQVNAYVASVSGVPVAFIFVLAFVQFGAGNQHFDLFSPENPLLIATLVGGLAGGLVYYGLGKRLGLWPLISENAS